MLKKELRRYYKNLRKRFSEEEKEILDKKIFENLLDLKDFQNANTVFCYVSMPDEVDTKRIIKYCLDNNKEVYLPKESGDHLMNAVKINSLDDIVFDKNKIGTSKLDSSIENPDIAIVPGLCFDRNLYRLGYGGGYYDNYIKNHKSKYVGLFYSETECEGVPKDEFDQKVDLILTEKEPIK